MWKLGCTQLTHVSALSDDRNAPTISLHNTMHTFMWFTGQILPSYTIVSPVAYQWSLIGAAVTRRRHSHRHPVLHFLLHLWLVLPEVDVLSSLCQQSVYHAGVFFARVHCSAFFSTVCAILGSNQRECKQEVQLGLFSVSHGKAATPTSRGDCWITVAVLQCKPMACNSNKMLLKTHQNQFKTIEKDE